MKALLLIFAVMGHDGAATATVDPMATSFEYKLSRQPLLFDDMATCKKAMVSGITNKTLPNAVCIAVEAADVSVGILPTISTNPRPGDERQ